MGHPFDPSSTSDLSACDESFCINGVGSNPVEGRTNI